MPVVTEDLREGHRMSEDRGSYTVERVFYVSALTLAAELQVMEALQDPGIPSVGDSYPLGAPSAFPVYDQLVCKLRDARPNGVNAVRVQCTYTNVSRTTFREPPTTNDGADLKRFSSAVVEKTTTKDRNGVAMSLSPPASRSTYKPYLSEADIFIAVAELVFVRPELTIPAARARTYVGTINSLTLNNYPAGTLLCVSINADGNDGELWDVEYVFRYRADGWKHRDTWRSTDGKPPSDAVEVEFDTLAEADHGALGLDFSDSQTPI